MQWRFETHLRNVLACVAMCVGSGGVQADTDEFTIIDDPELDAAIAQVRADFLGWQPFDRLDVTLLVLQQDGTWLRGSHNPEEIAYPASCVKLAYLAAAMRWCAINGLPYDALDYAVEPMIVDSSNYWTGVVVDEITGRPNDPDITSPSPEFFDWVSRRFFTEEYLDSRGLLGNQTILHKTYPSNSGSSPGGAEQVAIDYYGGNRMQPKLSASLMLEIVKGAIEPGATEYMRSMLASDRWGGNSSFGFGLPPGCVYENKLGVAYDTLEDIAYVKLPGGTEFIVAAYSNGWAPSQPYPYDAAPLGVFLEKLVDHLELNNDDPPKIIIDDADPQFTTTGSWTTSSAQPDRYGDSYRYAPGSEAACAQWALQVPEAGLYEVAIWFSQSGNRAVDAPFTVYHADGASTFIIDQQTKGGRWVLLGDFQFEAGGGLVEVTTDIADGAQLVIADAVKATKHPDPADACPGDATGDGMVGLDDLLMVIGQWSTAGPQGDLDEDGTVGLSDLLTVIGQWGQSCTD